MSELCLHLGLGWAGPWRQGAGQDRERDTSLVSVPDAVSKEDTCPKENGQWLPVVCTPRGVCTPICVHPNRCVHPNGCVHPKRCVYPERYVHPERGVSAQRRNFITKPTLTKTSHSASSRDTSVIPHFGN